jgi:MFS family permease
VTTDLAPVETPLETSLETPFETPAAPAPSLGYAWYVVFVLMICYTLSFIDRQILALLVGPIKSELQISDTAIGLLQGLAFALFYTICGLPMGRIADRSSRRNLVAIGILLWSAMTGLCAAARSFTSLFLARMGVGIGEAALSPGAFSLIADYFPKERLSAALSVYSMGVFIGSGLALMVGGTVVQAVTKWPAVEMPLLGVIAPWRFTFLAVGLPGVLVALLTLTVREPLRRNALRRKDGQAARLTTAEVIEQLRLRWQSVAGVSLGMGGQSMCTYAFTAWGPSFFQRVHGWTSAQTGQRLGLVILITGCTGMYLGGALSDRWLKRGMREAPLRVGVLASIGVAISFGVAFLMPGASAGWTLAFLVPGLFFLALPIGSAYASLQLIFPNQVRGQVTALLLVVFNLIGLTLGPLLPGALNDYVFHDERMVGPSIALTVIAGSLVVVTLFRSIYAPYRRHHALMHPHEDAAPT